MMDWSTLPLHPGGRSLVEASAGTGKTWTIAVLYLRLLLEQQLSPRQIVVSTFTNAAAAELRERLRGKLLWALAEADRHRGGRTDDGAAHADAAWLHARWRADWQALDADVRRLQAALADFDAAPVSTLHALCSRILADHPFAAGALFRGRTLVDAKSLEAALVADLWRVIAQGDPTQALVAQAWDLAIDFGTLQKYVPALLQPNVVVDRALPFDLRAALCGLEFLQDPDAWIAQVRAWVPAYTNSGARLRRAWLALAEALEQGGGVELIAPYLADYAGCGALTGINKAGKGHAGMLGLVEQTQRIAQALDGSALHFDLAHARPLRQFLEGAQRWCRSALQARLDAAHQSTFDELLVTVHDALAPRDGQRALADALFADWPVALVDEFQDTDPLQFGILDAIYRDAGGAPRGRLVMIGDPKQAIYRFRGGDIQAYERARADALPQDRLVLGVNHRSSRGYVAAVNQFYAATGRTLGPAASQTGIAYADVEPSSRRDDAPLRFADGSPVAQPLVLHRIAPHDDSLDLEALALRACAGEIVHALSGDGYRLGDSALQPGDIAVLLPNNAQVGRLAAMLKARGVPCVSGSQKSVFQTDVARELRLVLHAVVHPQQPGGVRAALATRLVGASLGELHTLRHDAAAWDARTQRFHALAGTLERGGPLALVADLLEEHAPRLLAAMEGERILTDLRHLGELLQDAWVSAGGGEQLLAWFAGQMEERGDGGDAGEARALRLESDAARVKVMTLHASKGLEFGVVFLPLMWKHAGNRQGACLLSDGTGAKYLVEAAAKDLVRLQEHEERFRILYVALTRAIHACHLFVLPQEQKVAGAIEGARKKEAPLNALDLSALTRGEAPAIRVVEGWNPHHGRRWRGQAAVAGVRSARPLPPPPAGPRPMRHSFTTLAAGGHQRVLEEAAAEDEARVEPVTVTALASDPAEAGSSDAAVTFHPQLDALAGVAGADFGNAVHALFEHRAPGQAFAPPAVLAALQEHGVRPREGTLEALAAPLAQRLQAVLETPLQPGGPRLSELAATDMRAELEFHYPLDGASLRRLREACEAHGATGLVPAREQTLVGLMNGKIDLVFAHGGAFHVLDYKGNRLADGPRGALQDYAPDALDRAMLATGYRFQALLYTVAVERYLRERLGQAYRRAEHLGDCWYLFIRAVGLHLPDGTPCGVWHERFEDPLLDAVQAVFGLALPEVA